MRPPTASTLHTSKHKCAMGVQNYLFNVSLAREIPKKFPIYTLLHTMWKNMGAAGGGVLWQYINIFFDHNRPIRGAPSLFALSFRGKAWRYVHDIHYLCAGY